VIIFVEKFKTDVIIWLKSHWPIMFSIRTSLLIVTISLCEIRGQSWPWSYGSWIYNYLCNQCLSPLMLWVRISIRERCTLYVIKFVSDLRQVCSFLRVLRFPPPITLTATIYSWTIVESGVKHHQTTSVRSKEECQHYR
jgi:hypothetical protein